MFAAERPSAGAPQGVTDTVATTSRTATLHGGYLRAPPGRSRAEQAEPRRVRAPERRRCRRVTGGGTGPIGAGIRLEPRRHDFRLWCWCRGGSRWGAAPRLPEALGSRMHPKEAT